jgi:hypothetical protein
LPSTEVVAVLAKAAPIELIMVDCATVKSAPKNRLLGVVPSPWRAKVTSFEIALAFAVAVWNSVTSA